MSTTKWIPAFWPDHDSMLEKAGIQIRRIDSDLNRLFNFVEADFTARNSGVRSLFCCAPYFRLNDVSRTAPACSQSSLLKAPLDIKQAITDERYRRLKKPVRREGGWYDCMLGLFDNTPKFINYWNYYELKILKFYYISLHILRGYIHSFCQIFQRLHLFNGLYLFRTQVLH